MKHLGSLTVLGCVAAVAIASPARATTAPVQVPGLAAAKVPAQVGFPLVGAWQPAAIPAGAPASLSEVGRYELRTPLSDSATCVRGAFVVGVAVRPAARPKLVGDTLRLRPEGSLLPKMQVEAHGAAGAVRWFAGGLHATRTVPSGANPPTQQGIAVLPAPKALVRGGRSVVVVRVALDARVEHLDANGAPIQATSAEGEECFAPVRSQLGPQLRSILRKVTVQRRAAAS